MRGLFTIFILVHFCVGKNVTKNGLVKIYWDLNGLSQEDPELIKAIKEEVLIKPSKEKINLKNGPSAKRLKGQFDQVTKAEEILKINESKKKGFFIEAGASCGEAISNTLYFELVHKWTGLLVEPNPDLLKLLYGKNRNAWILPHCLSTKKEVEVVEFDAHMYNSGIIKEGKVLPSNLGVGDRPHKGRKIQVQCFPLYSVLAALDFPHVDYFSLDIEGAEFVVLETLPQINMTLISIEVNHAGDIFPGNRNDIGHLLEKHGFKYAATAHIDDFYYKKEANRFLKTKIKTDL